MSFSLPLMPLGSRVAHYISIWTKKPFNNLSLNLNDVWTQFHILPPLRPPSNLPNPQLPHEARTLLWLADAKIGIPAGRRKDWSKEPPRSSRTMGFIHPWSSLLPSIFVILSWPSHSALVEAVEACGGYEAQRRRGTTWRSRKRHNRAGPRQ